jgi:two-component system, sensor histidine kinase and response regulator
MANILVAEDDLYVLENLIDILELEGYETLKAMNGKEAIEMAIEYNPDLILCDISMPEYNGYQVLERLRKSPSTFNTPFIFLTALAEKEFQRKGMVLGADDFITKPYSSREIIDAINVRLQKHQVLKKQSEKVIEELRKSIALSLPHEFRTPLNGLLGFSQMLKADFKMYSEDEIQIMLNNIHESAHRLHKLIVNYLFYVNLINKSLDEAHKYRRVPIATDITIIDQANIVSSNYERQNDINFHLEEFIIKFPEQYFQKVVEEILDNAFKFSESNTKVTITTFADEEFFNIKVHNYGRSMTNEFVKQIGAFSQFERDLYEQQGLGLGLAIVKKIADVFDGKLTINNEIKSQISVIFSLPLKELLF